MILRNLLVVVSLLVATAATAQTGPVVRFAGPVNQDGCAFCCEFSCQGQPTPVPEFDDQGRRVFRRSSGHFLLVVEAGLGTSSRQVGTEGVFSGGVVQSITHSSGQPSLMALSDKNLGNGSLQVDCRSEPIGGVRGFPALDFSAGTNATTAMVDLACRFEFASSATLACTRDGFGNFAFLNPQTSRQFCTQIANADEFPQGRTTVAVQLRDISGNLGPRHEFVVVVDSSVLTTPTPTGTATPTPTPTRVPANIAGSIRYYANTRPVPNATARLTGAATQNAVTNSAGAYQLTNLPAGTMTVEPRKVGDFGSPSAISALDASHVLQTIAGMRTLDTRQRLAADVTGNGSLSALDAAHILQRVVGLLSRFSVATRCDSDWVFDPIATAGSGRRLITPLITSTSCRRGAIAYEPLTTSQTGQDFVGLLFGDCTGNWQPPAAGLQARASAAMPDVRLRASRRTIDGKMRVPIAVDAVDEFSAVDLTIALGPGLRAESVRTMQAAGGALMISNLTDPSRPRIALASGMPLKPGAILVLDLAAEAGAAPDVRLVRALVDDAPAIATTGAARIAD